MNHYNISGNELQYFCAAEWHAEMEIAGQNATLYMSQTHSRSAKTYLWHHSPDFYSFAVKINTINTQKTRNLNIFGFFCYFLFTLCSIYAIIRYIYTWRLT